MRQKRQQEVYTASFPSTWASSSPPSPAERVPSQDSHSQHSSHSSLDLQNGRSSRDGQRVHTEINEVEKSVSRDFALRSPLQRGESVSLVSITPTGSENEKRPAIPSTHGTHLTVPKSQSPLSRSRAASTPTTEYSTVYPASWTVSCARDIQQPTPAAVLSASSPSPNPLSFAAGPISARSTSTTSQGDVGPISPMRRRQQRDFQSMSHPPSQPGLPQPPRSASMGVPASQQREQIERLLGIKTKATSHQHTAAQDVMRAEGDVPERHTSSISNYSTLEQASSQRFKSKADTPANHRIASMAFSDVSGDG